MQEFANFEWEQVDAVPDVVQLNERNLLPVRVVNGVSGLLERFQDMIRLISSLRNVGPNGADGESVYPKIVRESEMKIGFVDHSENLHVSMLVGHDQTQETVFFILSFSPGSEIIRTLLLHDLLDGRISFFQPSRHVGVLVHTSYASSDKEAVGVMFNAMQFPHPVNVVFASTVN